MGRFSLRAMLTGVTVICLLFGANSLSGAKWEWPGWWHVTVSFGDYPEENIVYHFGVNWPGYESWSVEGGTIYRGKMRRIWVERRGGWFFAPKEQRYFQASDRECYDWSRNWPQDLVKVGITNRGSSE